MLTSVDAARRASPSRSSPSRPPATTRARSCASSRSAASGGPAPTPRSSARCRRATTSRRSRRAASSRRTLGKFVVDGLVSQLARLHGSRTSPPRWRRISTRSKPAGSGASRCSKRFYKRFREQLDKSKKQKRWAPEPHRDRPGLRRVRLEDAEALEQERLVPRLRGVPQVQEHAGSRARRRGDDADSAPHDRLQMRQVRQADGHQDRPLRRVPVVHRLPGVQERASRCRSAIPCPKCGGDIIEIKSRRRGGTSFYGCSNYSADIKCDFKLWQKPVPEPCPHVRREVPGDRRRQEEPDARLLDRRSAASRSPSRKRSAVLGKPVGARPARPTARRRRRTEALARAPMSMAMTRHHRRRGPRGLRGRLAARGARDRRAFYSSRSRTSGRPRRPAMACGARVLELDARRRARRTRSGCSRRSCGARARS